MRTSMAEMPAYVVERLRRDPPPGGFVVPNSTPVLSFGDPTTARIATLGINPSRLEFVDNNGAELNGKERRLHSLRSLGRTSLADASLQVLRTVVEDCAGYFRRNPYRRWFDQLDLILNACCASYYNGSACHLDLVQWATNPTWSNLWCGVQAMLIRSDAPFLLKQLENKNIHVLLLNGRTVLREFSTATNIDLAEQAEQVGGRTRMFTGCGPNGMLIVGWSTNLQSSRGVTNEHRLEIAQAVASLIRSAG